jgi:hypothetical protein
MGYRRAFIPRLTLLSLSYTEQAAMATYFIVPLETRVCSWFDPIRMGYCYNLEHPSFQYSTLESTPEELWQREEK